MKLFNRPEREFIGIIGDDEIIKAGMKILFAVLGENPLEIDPSLGGLPREYDSMKLDGLHPDDKILKKFYSKKHGNIICAIVCPPIDVRFLHIATIFHINFYEIENKVEGKICDQIRICSGFDAVITGLGIPNKIDELEKTLQSQYEVRWTEMFTSWNKKKLGWVLSSILAGAVIYAKEGNLF